MIASLGNVQGLPFYTQRRVVILGGLAELEFASRQGDQSAWFPDLQGFIRLWDSETPVFAVIPAEGLQLIQIITHKPPRVIARKEGKLLVSNR